jgi:hypothetical protein
MLPLVACVKFLCHFLTLSSPISLFTTLFVFFYSLQLMTRSSPPSLLASPPTHFPIFPHVLDPAERYFQFVLFIPLIFLLISSIMYVCILLFCSLSSVILLSVYFVILLSVLSFFFLYCSATNIASCSAWLFVKFLFSRSCMFWCVSLIQ